MAIRQMNEPVACTIVANNYLAYARVVARSFLHHHHRGRFFVLIVGRRAPELAYADVPPRMWPVARRSLLAHVQRIEALQLAGGEPLR